MLGISACGTPEQVVVDRDEEAHASTSDRPAAAQAAQPADQLSAFRVRSDFSSPLNADQGWAGTLNENVTIDTEAPFRIRFELESPAELTDERRYRLQYRHNGGPWMMVEAADFPYPDEKTPRVSIVSTPAFQNGATTTDLLDGSTSAYASGAGISLDEMTPSLASGNVQSEWEWPLVIRRYFDGAVPNDDGDTLEFRMADAGGCPIASSDNPVITVSVPPRLLGGTFVETPGRLGPWAASNGDLYFIMEPSETDNVMMVVKSTDGGETWQEADPENRPIADDLEGFATALHEGAIYMLHQQSDDVWLHSFRTSDHPTNPDTWDIRDEHVVAPEEPPTQVATLAVRSDGSMVGIYGGPEKVHFKIRSSDGMWGEETVLDPGVPPATLSGPQAVLGADDVVHLAYTGSDGTDGTVWYRRIEADGKLSPREQLASGIGIEEEDVGSVLPLIFIPETNTAVMIYRLATGKLWERRIVDHGVPSEPVQVSDRNVVQGAVDSDQTGADAIAVESTVHVLFIEEGTGSIYHTWSDEDRIWQTAELVQDGINAQWIRGQPLRHTGGEDVVYGFVYDAGSNGGTGMNRYAEVALNGR